jgi:hypothetical protein
MSTATVEKAGADVRSAVGDKAADVIRAATHAAHDARMLKTLAADAVEDGVYAARRAARVAKRDFEDVRDELAHRVKRQPFKALAFALLAGVGLGFLTAAAAGACRRAGASERALPPSQ